MRFFTIVLLSFGIGIISGDPEGNKVPIFDSNLTFKGWEKDLDSFNYYEGLEKFKEKERGVIPKDLVFDFGSISSSKGGFWAVLPAPPSIKGTSNVTSNVTTQTKHTTLYYQDEEGRPIDTLTLTVYLHNNSYIFVYKGEKSKGEIIRKVTHNDTQEFGQKFTPVTVHIRVPSFTLEFGVPEKGLILLDRMWVEFQGPQSPQQDHKSELSELPQGDQPMPNPVPATTPEVQGDDKPVNETTLNSTEVYNEEKKLMDIAISGLNETVDVIATKNGKVKGKSNGGFTFNSSIIVLFIGITLIYFTN